VLGKEFHDLEALAVKPFVHIFAGLFEHHFDLALGRFEREDTAEDGTNDGAQDACQSSE
jgi:hypothetical protein